MLGRGNEKTLLLSWLTPLALPSIPSWLRTTSRVAERGQVHVLRYSTSFTTITRMTTAPNYRALCASMLNCFDDLVSSSSGVAGLHLDGDPAPWIDLTEVGRFEEWTQAFVDARAALNTPPLAPIPVSERLPGAEDCDADGRCWVGICDSAAFRSWSLVRVTDVRAWVRYLRPVWLPHWAIPLPEES